MKCRRTTALPSSVCVADCAPGEGGGNSPIKMTGVLVVPFRGKNLSIGTAWGAII